MYSLRTLKAMNERATKSAKKQNKRPVRLETPVEPPFNYPNIGNYDVSNEFVELETVTHRMFNTGSFCRKLERFVEQSDKPVYVAITSSAQFRVWVTLYHNKYDK